MNAKTERKCSLCDGAGHAIHIKTVRGSEAPCRVYRKCTCCNGTGIVRKGQ